MNQYVDAQGKAEDDVGQFAIEIGRTLCCHTSSVDEMKFAREDCLSRMRLAGMLLGERRAEYRGQDSAIIALDV